MTTTEQPRSRLTPMMTAARTVATDATMEISPAALEAFGMRLPSTGDPVDDLVARVRPRGGDAVDSLQIAALLEADGVNDRGARVEYGYTDVFDLAEEVYRRLGGTVARLRPLEEAERQPGRTWREVSHGLLYLLPSALFPAVVAVVLPQPLVVALVVAGALGWVWAGGTTWLAYQWLNANDTHGAGRVLAWSSAAGIPVAAVAGVVVALATGGGFTAAILVPGVMAYQLASTLLLFYRRELWLAGLMAPAAGAGIAYVVVGRPMLLWALGAVSACVLVALGFGLHQAVWQAGHAGRDKQARPSKPRIRVGVFLLVLAYTGLSAAFLLHAQAPYLLTNLDVVLACAPLIVAMGVVEWRARHFVERSRRLLGQVRYPSEFVRRVWLLLAANVAVCWLAVAACAAAVLGALHYAGWLGPAGIAMAGAQVALAGAYFLGFILAGHQRYGWLCGALGASILVHLVTAWLFATTAPSPRDAAFIDLALYFGSAVLLQALLVAALVPVLGQARRYR
jgi:hypothetical protein